MLTGKNNIYINKNKTKKHIETFTRFCNNRHSGSWHVRDVIVGIASDLYYNDIKIVAQSALDFCTFNFWLMTMHLGISFRHWYTELDRSATALSRIRKIDLITVYDIKIKWLLLFQFRSNSIQENSEASGVESDGDRTLDLSLSKDPDVQVIILFSYNFYV